MQFLALALLGSLGLSLALPAPHGHILHERRETRHSPWRKIEKLDRDTLLPMRIGLVQSNLHLGPDLLMDVYVRFQPVRQN